MECSNGQTRVREGSPCGARRRRRPHHAVPVTLCILLFCALWLALPLPCCVAQPAASPAPATGVGAPEPAGAEHLEVSGHWEGAIEIPGTPLAVVVELAFIGGMGSGTIDIPVQGATGLPLEGVSVDGQGVRFAIKGIPGNPTFAGSLVEGKITGTFTQGGQSFPFTLGREKLPQLGRPQEPKPPFPYKSDEVSYANSEVRLAGTLTIPEGKGPFPAILLLSGSGSQDRDETIFGHKPFLLLADDLARAGIATLRVDDRGVGGSAGDPSTATIEILAADALAGAQFLKGRPEIDPGKIGVLGHSEGGLVASLAASRSTDFSFVLLLASPGVPGDSILVRQMEMLARASGAEEKVAAGALVAHRAFVRSLKEGADDARLMEEARQLIKAQIALQEPNSEPPPEQVDAMAAGAVRQGKSLWLKDFVNYDPRPALRALKVPVLALAGDLDVQVEADQNIPEIVRALEEGGNREVAIHRFPGLNHLFQTAQRGTVEEYGQIQETMSPLVLETIRTWALERTRPR